LLRDDVDDPRGNLRHIPDAGFMIEDGKPRRKEGYKRKPGRGATLVVRFTLRRGEDGRFHGPCNNKAYGTDSTALADDRDGESSDQALE